MNARDEAEVASSHRNWIFRRNLGVCVEEGGGGEKTTWVSFRFRLLSEDFGWE